MLAPRTGTVLKSIIEQYIGKGVPISSQCITGDCALSVSSATIRNEMAHLEHEGYIIRPHTSAGSIPTDKGYRYYVESLDNVELPLVEQNLISHLFHQANRALEEWLSLAATLIAMLAQNVAIVTMPKTIGCRFKHVELVSLQNNLALVIVVFWGAKLRQQLIAFNKDISQQELSAMANKLNDIYANLTSSKLAAKSTELSSTEQQVTDCVINMMKAEDEPDYEKVYLEGWHFLFNQPEFTQINRMIELMELAEHRNLLKTILPHDLPEYGVKVIIGKENKAEVVQYYSVILGQYGLPNQAAGTIGVVGPTRMPYGRAISTVEYLSSVLSWLVAEIYGGRASIERGRLKNDRERTRRNSD